MGNNIQLIPTERDRTEKIRTLQDVSASLQVSIIDEAEQELATLQEAFNPANIPADLSDKEDYKFVHRAIQAIKKPRIALEKSRKELVGPLNDIVKKINAAAKPIKEAYLDLQHPWETAKKDHDRAEEIRKREERIAEENRVQAILDHIAEVKALPMKFITAPSKEIKVALADLEKEEFDYQEFAEKGQEVKAETLTILEQQYSQKVVTEQAELAAAEAKEKAEKERLAREEAERKERERIAKEQAETARKLAEQQAEIARQKKELEYARIAAEKAEREKAEREAKKKAEQERLEREAAEQKERERLVAEAEKKRIAAEKKRQKELAARTEELKAETLKDLSRFKKIETLLAGIIAGKVRNVSWTPEVN